MDSPSDGLFRKLCSPFGTGLLLSAVILCAFFPCLSAGFLNWDDPGHLLRNPLLPLSSWSDVWRIFLTADTGNRTYNPLVILSFGIERSLVGPEPFLYHLDNILLHILSALLVRTLALRMGLSAGGSLIAAMIFAIHPMRVESVAWVTERKDVLFGAFYLGSLIFYWDYLKSGRGWNYIGALLCGIASILAKPMALSLPLVLFLLDRMAGRKGTYMSWVDKLPFMAALWPVAWITGLMNIHRPETGPLEALLVLIYSAVFYIVKFFAPNGLAIIYPVPRPVSFLTPEYAGAVLIFAVLVLFLWFTRRKRWVTFSFAFYVLSMFFLWRTDLYDGSKGIVSDRFMYIPSLGFALLLGDCWDRFFFRRPGSNIWTLTGGWFLAGMLCVVLAGSTFTRCLVWRDNIVFWGDVLRHDPDNTFALINRAASMLEDQESAGRYALSDSMRYQAALHDLQKAVKRAPLDPDAWNNLGVVLDRLGRTLEADEAFARSGMLGGPPVK